MTRKLAKQLLDRRGFTLVELLIAITLLTTMAVFGFHVISMMLNIQRANMESATASLSLSRLSERFRNDIHSAHEIRFKQPVSETVERYQVIEIDWGGNTVVYQTVEDGVERIVPSSNSNRPTQRDIFRLPNINAEFVEEESVVSLLLYAEVRGAETSRTSEPEHRIEAAVLHGGAQ
ncbi:MAG: prepilin-type N-terminal cleavage/methylation domain-containing protein [Planctomycetaceae bacterium]